MIRKIALAGAAAALALAGFSAFAGSASAAPPTISAINSAAIQCDLAPTTAKLSPGLKNNWVKANHNGINDVGAAAPGADPNRVEGVAPGQWNDTETNPYVKGIANTKFSSDLTNTVSSKSKTASCTGNVVTPQGTFPVTSLKIELLNYTAGVDNPPLNTANTCQGLLAGTQAGDVAATYKAIISPKVSGAKLPAKSFNTTGLSLVAGGGGAIGFQISGGTSDGIFNGSNSKTTAYITGATLAAVGATPATSAAPTQNTTADDCESSLKIKADKVTPGKPTKPGSASLKGPKGFKKIPVGDNLLVPGQHSNICIRVGSTCP